MVVGLCVAVIDEGEPEFEGVDLCAWRTILKQFLKRVRKRPGILVVAIDVDSLRQRQLYAGGRLKRREAGALKTPRQALLAIGATNVRDPCIVGEKAQGFREARR